jgi:hypothetical protein
MAKKNRAKKPPHKKATHERPLKNRPHDNEVPAGQGEGATDNPGNGQEAGGEPGEQLETPDNPKKSKRTPKQRRLPGLEDPVIQELEGLAEEYADARDRRMEIGEEEVKLKTELLDEMKKRNRERYFHAGILIEVINSKDKVRVRIKKDD